MNTETIAGIASGMGGGIGIIRISGDDVVSIMQQIFCTKSLLSLCENKSDYVNELIKNTKISEWKSHTIHYGYIIDQGELIDEVLVTYMKAPNSYTCENVMEINTHGGAFVVQKVLKCVVEHGARLAEPGEFTKRAFLNGRIDLSQAEAVMKMISSQNEFALKSAVNQLEGSVSQFIEKIRQEILHNMGYIETALDDPEHISLVGFADTLRKTTQKEVNILQELLANFDNGRMKSEGINTVIVGKPNAGKSSLMNLLLDEDRAIVTNIAGTTRDILEEKVKLGNVTLNLVDTAGIHETEDLVEGIGVDKAVDYLNRSDFILYVVDSSVKLDPADYQIIELIKSRKGVILLNKSDLDSAVSEQMIKKVLDWNIINFSNTTRTGLQDLEEYIVQEFLNGNISYNNQIYLTSLRHKEAVTDALNSLKQVIDSIDLGLSEDFFTIDMMDAYRKLGLINGETASEDLVNKIFKDFCMGK